MPATSVDTLLACSIMIALVLSSMAGVLTAVHPYLQNQSSKYATEMNHKLAEYLLLECGDPSDWGSETNPSLTSFGLAKADFLIPFDLDIDKVTKLNQENFYSIGFTDAFTALGAQDKPFRIKIKPVFDVTLNLNSQVVEGDQTVYHFAVYTRKSTLPVSARLRFYTALGEYIINTTSSTSASGVGSVEVALPNSLNGTALLIAIAKIEPKTMSYSVYSFKHNSLGNPYPQGTFIELSPLNYTLRAELLYSGETNLRAKVFTYNYYFNLTKTDEAPNVEYHGIPRLLDASPMILTESGFNGTTSFAEWIAYPQIPLDFGSNFTGEHDVMNSYSFHFLVNINSALYECEIILGGNRVND